LKANQYIEKPLNLKSFKGLVDSIYPNKSYCLGQEELWKWFIFAVSGKGIFIRDLLTDELAQFSDQLIKLVYAVYWSANLKKEDALNHERNHRG
jgi:hypothetical protein